MANTLIDLDFAPGIRAEYLNKNFNLIHEWLMRERLRTAGWGLVEGFSLEADIENSVITVGNGLMINTEGEEVAVPGKVFSVGAMDAIQVEDNLIAPDDGCIRLKQRPYSSKARGFFGFVGNVDKDYPVADEFCIIDVISGLQVPVIQINGMKVTINADDWKGRELNIKYCTTKDRIDSIMLYKDGSYKYEKSIVSSSPSHVDLGDYDKCYMIGVVYWHVDLSTTVEFFTDHRTYRKVYVDEQNRLWLNGKLYKEAQIIYMKEPEDPKEHDLWYDSITNTLMIWQEKDGVYGWVIVNDQASIEERQVKIFYPNTADFPKDMQHFRFRDDEVNLHYVPGRSCLSIVIDNVQVMTDQFIEYVPQAKEAGKDYLALGKGFDLKAPLDRATPVEVVVKHAVKAKPVRETFQRAAIFIAESFDHYIKTNTEKVFETITEYAIGDNQLEVFIDGKRLTNGIDFVEMKTASHEATTMDVNQMSKRFKIKCDVADGALVTHKISKHVWSFDQLNAMVHEIEEKANKANIDILQLRSDIKNLNENVGIQVENIRKRIDTMEKAFGNPEQYLTKTSMISKNAIPDDVTSRLMGDKINQTFSAKMPIVLENTKLLDMFFVYYISANMNRMLIQGTEYTPVAVGKDIRIDLQPGLKITGASVYISGIKMGV